MVNSKTKSEDGWTIRDREGNIVQHCNSLTALAAARRCPGEFFACRV